jgi:hypothetical protein
VRLSWQKSALRGSVGVEREETDACRSKRASYPVAEWCGELNSAFGMLDTDLPDRDGRDPQAISVASLIQLPDACVR